MRQLVTSWPHQKAEINAGAQLPFLFSWDLRDGMLLPLQYHLGGNVLKRSSEVVSMVTPSSVRLTVINHCRLRLRRDSEEWTVM